MTTKGIIFPAPNSANWDVPLNANFAAIEKAFGNSATITATAGITILTTDQVGHMCLRCTGALTANLTLQVPIGTAGQWVVVNATTDATGGPWDVSIISAARGAHCCTRGNNGHFEQSLLVIHNVGVSQVCRSRSSCGDVLTLHCLTRRVNVLTTHANANDRAAVGSS